MRPKASRESLRDASSPKKCNNARTQLAVLPRRASTSDTSSSATCTDPDRSDAALSNRWIDRASTPFCFSSSSSSGNVCSATSRTIDIHLSTRSATGSSSKISVPAEMVSFGNALGRFAMPQVPSYINPRSSHCRSSPHSDQARGPGHDCTPDDRWMLVKQRR